MHATDRGQGQEHKVVVPGMRDVSGIEVNRQANDALRQDAGDPCCSSDPRIYVRNAASVALPEVSKVDRLAIIVCTKPLESPSGAKIDVQ